MSLHLEVNETEQLMQNEIDEEEQKVPHHATSPVTSIKMSSGAASLTSKNLIQNVTSTGNNSINESTKISYVSERRLHRDLMRSNNKPRQVPKDAPDVKHMEKALLELLDDFHTGKLSAFGSGCSMEQMINIRDQQEHLARLHFRLCGDVEKPIEEGLENSASHEQMAQLVESLEQLSASIERLHTNDTANENMEDTSKKPAEGSSSSNTK